MSKNFRRFLSMLLAAAMVLSHAQISFAADSVKAAGTSAAESKSEGAKELETEPMDPSRLGIKKLGEETEEGDGDEGEISLTPDTSLEQTVRVSIFLNGKSTVDAGYSTQKIASNRSAVAYNDSLLARQAQLTSRIEAVLGHKLDVKWNLTILVNAISANVKVKEIPLIERLDGVERVARERHYEAPIGEGDATPQTANTSANMVGAANAWYQLGYTGAGSRIAIIDTGLDVEHQSVDAEAFMHAIEEVEENGKTVSLMTQAELNAIPETMLKSGSHNYVNAKVPYAYNYVDENIRVDHKDTASNHGSHVAGIAAANRYIKSGSDFVDAAQTVKAVGMAPDAQILVMKVFSSSGASDSDYFAALEDAIVLGADAANLSLGSPNPGWTYDPVYQDKLNALVGNTTNNHLVVAISAGNSYAADDFVPSKHLYAEDVNFHTGGEPGSVINSLGVAAAQNTLTEGAPLIFNGSRQVFYSEDTENNDGVVYTKPLISTIAGTWDYVYIDAIGNPEDYAAVNSAVSLSGKIVIINRGEIAFYLKGNNLNNYNPKGLIVANDSTGVIHMDLSDFTGKYPYVAITLKDANLIKADGTAQTANGVTYYTGRVQVTTTVVTTATDRSEAEITDFSSWGVPGSLIMKPEITAPGGDIYSINGTSTASSDSNTGTTSYVTYSGTSMAAPHIAGLAAVLMQYLKEKTPANTELTDAYNLRAIAQSLLMSTATPMLDVSGQFLPILQQGSGLVEVSDAIQAKSVIMMNEAGLTTATGAAADGKVKVELGEDPERTGRYDFSFTIYNISDETLSFVLDTVLFTQAVSGEYLSHKTTMLPWPEGVTYEWNGTAQTESHDVDKDGDTDVDDAEAILDYLTGLAEAADLDLEAGEMDGDDTITSYDAYLLLDWLQSTPTDPSDGYDIAPHGKAQVTVHISLTDAQKAVFEARENGGYLEGFTYVSCVTSTGEGEDLSHEHTIPILGYYGSWTDPSMFDTNSYTESLYGNTQKNYSGSSAEGTNYVRITTNGTLAKFSGNPYIVEDEFPEDLLAIRSDATINNLAYNMIRSAAGTGFAISKLDSHGNIASILTSALTGQNVYGCWFHVNNNAWQNTITRTYNINKALNEFSGLAEGDRVRVGYYAIPEYYTMQKSDDLTDYASGVLTPGMFRTILAENILGKGAFMGFDFTIDDTDPEVTSATLNGNTLSITANDNMALAYVAVLSLDGSVKYAEAAPGTDTFTVSFDASDAIANAQGYVAAFVGDYAGNEAAVAVKVNENMHAEKTVYVLTDTLAAGEKYLIVDRNTAGAGHGLAYTQPTGNNATTANVLVYNPDVKAGDADTNGKPYIESSDAAATGIWTAASGITLSNVDTVNRTWYMGRSNNNNLTIGTAPANKNWSYDGTNNRLANGTRYYLRYYSNTFSLNTSTNYKIYLYVETKISYEVDPYSVSSVTVTPNPVEIYRGGTVNLTAKVAPLTAEDRAVIWSSNNESIATVDEYGVVTGVAAGTTTIRATSHADSTKFGECAVTVVAINKELSAAVYDEEGNVYFSSFNANNLPTWTKRHKKPASEDVMSAMMASTSALYAATNDLSTGNIYTVDRTSYALTLVGENFVVPFGMATVGTSFGGTSYFVYAFASFIILGNLQPEDDDEYGTYCGFPYGLLDLSETDVGDAYAVAICCRNKSTTSAGYYFLDEMGKIWQTNQSYSSTAGITFSAPTLVYDTGINAGLTNNSIYYDGTNLYWTHVEGDMAELLILANANNASSRKFYHAGTFGADVWPVAGLYVDGKIAPASVGGENEIMEEGGETVELSSLRILATRDELLTENVRARLAAEAERLAAKKGSAPAETEPAEIPADVEIIEVPAETSAAPEAAEEVTEVSEANKETAEAEEPAVPAETEAEPEASAETVTEPETPAEPAEEPPVTVPAEAEEPAEGPADGTAPEAELPEEESETVMAELPPEMVGGLNFVRVNTKGLKDKDDLPLAVVAETEPGEEEGTVKIVLDETINVTNGYFIVSFVNSGLELISTYSPLAHYSLNVNDDEIAFAYANKMPIPAGTELLSLVFARDCDETVSGEITINTRERNTDLGLNESATVTVPGLDHDYSGAPASWVWTGSDDTSWTAAYAEFVCRRDENHTKKQVMAAITTSAEGDKLVYTATVTGPDGETYTDQKQIAFKYYLIGSMTEWAVNSAYEFTPNGAAAGEYILHLDDLTVGAEIKVIRQAGTNTGYQTWYPDNAGNYTVDYAHSGSVNVYFRPAGNSAWTSFHTGGFFYISKLHTATIVAVGSGEASINPEAPDVTATVYVTPEPDDGYHYLRTELYKKTGPGENDLEPVTLDWNEEAKTFTMPDFDVVIKVYFEAHKWGTPGYTWNQAGDHVWTCTAERVCSVCGEKESETATAQQLNPSPEAYPQYPAATCTTWGWTMYHVRFTNSAFKPQDHFEQDIAPDLERGHKWVLPPIWSWTGSDEAGYTAATATFACEYSDEHTRELTDSDLEYEVTLAPTTESTGKAVYTARVTFDEVEYTATKEITLAILPQEGYHIIIDDRTKGGATTSIEAERLYSGEVTFTVDCENACALGIVNADGSITRLACATGEDGTHGFTVTVTDADVNVIVVIKGDANLDGKVKALDASMTAREAALRMAEQEGILNAVQAFAADVKGYGSIMAIDASFIAREAATLMAGLESIMTW